MATISITPGALVFHPGASNAEQQLTLVVRATYRRSLILVPASAPGGPFAWSACHTLLEPAGELSIPVTFTPASEARVPGTLTIDAGDVLAPGTPRLRGFPLNVPLDGNAPGVGPGALDIRGILPDPPGADLGGEVVFVANTTSRTLDLAGCTFGDGREYKRLEFGSVILRPFATSGDMLRIWTGSGPTFPGRLDIPLRKRAPIWNTAGDTAWIRNENGQLIASRSTSPRVSVPPQRPASERLCDA